MNSTAKHYPLSLLNGIGKKTIADMRRQGFTTLNQLVQLQPDDLRQFYGIKTRAARYHAQARAWVDDTPVWTAPLPEICTRDAWYFDIETVPVRPNEGQVWSIGWSKGDQQTRAVLVASDLDGKTHTLSHGHTVDYVRSYREAWAQFEQAVGGDDEPIFHWSGFDAGNMRAFVPDVYARMGPRLVDLSRVFADTVQIPRKGVSLKVVAPYLGFAWQAYDNWFLAWTDYRHWLATRDENKLVGLSHYQADDVLAMIVIRDWLVHNENR